MIEKREPMPCAHPNRVVRNISPQRLASMSASPVCFLPFDVADCVDCGALNVGLDFTGLPAFTLRCAGSPNVPTSPSVSHGDSVADRLATMIELQTKPIEDGSSWATVVIGVEFARLLLAELRILKANHLAAKNPTAINPPDRVSVP